MAIQTRFIDSSEEVQRLEALQDLNILDTAPQESFDRISRMAARLFNLPIAAVSLTDSDRQWFKSRVGVEHWGIPRDKAPCAEVAETCGILVVEDFAQHPVYSNCVLSDAGIRFYAGVPLMTRDGYGLGSLCVLGTEPRTVDDSEMAALGDLAAMVMSQVELQHAFGRIEPVTGLPNRQQFIEDMTDLAIESPDRTRIAIMFDLLPATQIEQLMRIMGSSHMDDLSQEAARRLKRFCKGQGYQITPTQFACLANPDLDIDQALRQVEDLILQSDFITDISLGTRVTGGLAAFNPAQMQPKDLLRALNTAVQSARDQGRPAALYSSDDETLERRRFRLRQDFQAALQANDQLRLVFQPRVTLETESIASAEALLRWRHPNLGEISPGEFVPLIEHTAMAHQMTAFVFDAALTQLADWRSRGLDISLSLNISVTNLNHPDFVKQVLDTLQKHAIEPQWLELELTESMVISNAALALKKLEQLTKAGMKIAIDDFGTGYSSLSYLQNLPASVVKIDQSFISALKEGNRERQLVKSMIKLLHDLGYTVVAEGIELREEVDLLRALECDEGQGYVFSRPIEATALENLMMAKRLAVVA
ncbi:sensor domain-containing phosphodiesterase [Allorhizobium sp. BGMRC 0089]|uniref:sensor domain-containing phosphodiesterase n=1 Tax=Allorhizobium sonneratiae TaxID=2934936 RepID=UPI0020338E59|nr:sensor domain-containing phosphodiesterase [Allorhizobium sonneratiae]